jgi:rhodanese-related sulfurtransferase
MNTHHSEDFLRLASEAKKQIRELPPLQALKLVQDGAVLLDVREKDEFAKDHLPAAAHLSRGLLEMRVHEVAPDKTQPIVCYCSGGNRGALAAATLKQMGYTQVFSIAGGLDACRTKTPAAPNDGSLPAAQK